MSRKKIIGRLFIITGTLLTGIMFTLTGLPVSAATEDEIMNKTLLNAARLCMKNTYTESVVSADDLQRGNGMILPLLKKEGKKNKIYVPTKVGNKIKDSSISCEEVFDGASGMPGVLSIYNKKVDAGSITSMGYKGNDGADLGKKCLRIEYIDNNREKHNTNSICFASSGNSKIVLDTDHMPQIENIDEDAPIRLIFDSGNNTIYAYHKRSGMYVAEKQVNNNDDWSQILAANLGSMADTALSDISSSQIISVTDANFSDISQAGASWSSKFTKLDPQYAGNELVKYLTNGEIKTLSQLQFTEKDKFDLYSVYFNRALANGDLSVAAAEDCTENKPSDKIAVKDGDKWCEVKVVDGHVIDQVTMIDDNKSYPGLTKPKPFNTILKALMDLNYDDPSMDGVDTGVTDNNDNAEESGNSGSSVCSGIGSLAYVICPVAELLGAAVDGMYSWIESNFLVIPASYFTQGGGNAVYDAWKIFQGYANVVFAIVLLVVILSQVTGFGVNNYGIKKMLPKLIVMAVLVNVSFILCQLAIDISNIVGYSLKNMFDGFANSVGGDDGAFGLGSAALALTSALLAVSTVVVAANTQFWKAWITPFILSLVTVAAGLIVFIVTLGVRQAGVIILVTLSPVALVCYALPNTKRIFDRWKRLFVSMLMVFPICGLLMGGGKLAGTLIAGAGNITEEAVIATVGAITGKHMAAINDASFATSVILDLVAMLVQVVPFFFIPTLVRGSVNGLANIGNLIAQKGSKWGNNARNALGRSDAMQSLQRGLDLSRAKGIERGLQRKSGVRSKLGFTNSLSARDSRKLGRIKQRIDQMQSEDAISSIQANVDYDRADRAEAIKASAQSAVMEGLVNEELKRAANDKSLSTDSDYRAALERAMLDAQDDPNDMGKAAKVKALSAILLKRGNTGRGEIGNSFLEILSHSSGKDFEAIKAQADTIMNDQGDVIKKSDARLFKILTKLRGLKSEAEFNTMLTDLNIKKGTDADGKVFYETDYDKAGAGDVSAIKLADGDDAILDAYIRAIQRGSVSSGEMAKLTAAAQEALTSPNIHLKAGVRSKIEKIAQGSALQSAALDTALDDVAAHPGDVHAQARANSLALNMSNTAAGREALHSKIIQRATAGRTAGIKQVADHIYNETHGLTDNYNHATPGMRKMLESIRNDASAGASTALSGIASRATSVRDATGATHYMDSQFDQHDLLNISASGATSGDLVGVDYADMDSNNLSQIARTITEASRTGYTGELKKNGVDAIANDMANQLRTNEVFRSPAYKSHVEEMNKILKTAGRSTIDPNNVRLPEPIPAPPPGYTSSGIWIGSGTETKRDKAAFEAWAQEAENIRLRNSKL